MEILKGFVKGKLLRGSNQKSIDLPLSEMKADDAILVEKDFDKKAYGKWHCRLSSFCKKRGIRRADFGMANIEGSLYIYRK